MTTTDTGAQAAVAYGVAQGWVRLPENSSALVARGIARGLVHPAPSPPQNGRPRGYRNGSRWPAALAKVGPTFCAAELALAVDASSGAVVSQQAVSQAIVRLIAAGLVKQLPGKLLSGALLYARSV